MGQAPQILYMRLNPGHPLLRLTQIRVIFKLGMV
jgi:hypothetical protein